MYVFAQKIQECIGLSVSGSVVIGEVLVKALAGFGRGLVGTFRSSCVRSLYTIHVTQITQDSESESESEREVEKHTHTHANAPAPSNENKSMPSSN
jgi:hypothetical protein